MKEIRNYKVLPMLCNDKGNITIKNLTGLMLDLAFRQAARLEENLSEMDQKVWLLYSWDIEFISPIHEEDEIEITTFPTYMKRFYAYRNFEIRKDGDLLLKAKACLILFDIVKKRASIIDEKILKAYGRHEETYAGKAYKKESCFENDKNIQVRNSDFDKNHHVNNGLYFDYLMEIDGFDERNISYIKIIYRNEIRKEYEVLLSYKKNENQVDFKIESNKEHAYGVISYV